MIEEMTEVIVDQCQDQHLGLDQAQGLALIRERIMCYKFREYDHFASEC